MHDKRYSLLIAAAFLYIFSADTYVSAQTVFDYDFESTIPAYGYDSGSAGEGLASCLPGPEVDLSAFTEHDISSGPTAIATLNSNSWQPEPDACYNFVGWNLGIGHQLGSVTPVGTVFSQRLASNDLSEYSLSFDAWTAGTEPFLGTPFQILFRGPNIDSATGQPEITLRVGIGISEVPIQLQNSPQTFTFALDELSILGGSIEDWTNAPFTETTQIELLVQPQGTIDSVGSDADNVLFVDNFALTAPHFDVELSTCDLNNDEACDGVDADLLVSEIANQTGLYDLTGDGEINQTDLSAWLAVAGAVNLSTQNSYLVGDANLDGTVDGLDFIDWNSNKFTSNAAWTAGDFTADGTIDGLDFIAWNSNKFTTANAAAVPEIVGTSIYLLFWGGFTLSFRNTDA